MILTDFEYRRQLVRAMNQELDGFRLSPLLREVVSELSQILLDKAEENIYNITCLDLSEKAQDLLTRFLLLSEVEFAKELHCMSRVKKILFRKYIRNREAWMNELEIIIENLNYEKDQSTQSEVN